MNGSLRVLNRQRGRRVDARFLRDVARELLAQFHDLKEFDLTIHLLKTRAMARLNEEALQHEGVTDVITFDYADKDSKSRLVGGIFVCVDEAIEQARQYRRPWQEELVRYVVHGVLHLRGYDDKKSPARRLMKREEDQLLKLMAGRFNLRKLERK